MFHRHKWDIYQGSGYSTALALRTCVSCPETQTLMIDVITNQKTWVDGNFFEDTGAPIFIIAESREAWSQTVNKVQERSPNAVFYWVRDQVSLNKMMEYRRPRFVLAYDWYEVGIIEHVRFATLFSTGHW